MRTASHFDPRRCACCFDDLTRRLYATDASIYQVTPAGVAFPRTAGEAAAAIRAAADAGLSVIPRGAGTGLVGGCLGDGLVIDFARHNRTIRDFDPQARTVRVGAGVILDELNAFLRPHGLWFGPDVATSSRATLGGMIANDSSGARVPVYGTTVDHVVSLELVLADGRVVEVAADRDGLPEARSAAEAILEKYSEAIAGYAPPGDDRPRKRRPGYGFGPYARRRGDLTRLIAGSEGTLAGIFSATVRAVPLPRRRGLGLLFFASVADAMQAAVELLDLRPAAVEHIDRILFDQTRGQIAFAAARALLRLDEQPAESILIVEFFDDVEDRLADLTRRRLGQRRRIVTDDAEQALVWGLRKAGLALLTGRPGPAKPITGIEDAAVRPEQLPEYVAALRRILDPLKVEASFYGHAASGLLHVRPVLDLHTAEGVAKLRYIADEVAALVRQFGGSLAGEHGVGMARTEYLPAQLGPELMAAHVELKAAFDPGGIMNPGKIVPAEAGAKPAAAQERTLERGRASRPFRIDTNLRQGAGYQLRLPFAPVLGFVDKDHSFVGNLEQCDGAGVCLKRSPAMCPTYIATGEEIMSTRGRANAIRSILERAGGDADRALRSGGLDAALIPCLSCKACKSECPSNVDLALLKAELLHQRHRRSGVPLADRVIASADVLGRLGSLTAPVTNRLLRWRPVRRLLEMSLGIAADRSLPAYARTRFDRWFARRVPDVATPIRGKVLLWDDTWVRYHEPHVGRAAVAVLERAGYEVVLPRGRCCCGRPAFSRGLLDLAASLGRHNLELLERAYPGMPIVFLEPSCLSMFLDEYRQLGLAGADRVRERCLSFEAFVADEREKRSASGFPAGNPGDDRWCAAGPNSAPLPRHVAIHAHCHARALTDVSVLARAARIAPGVEVRLLDTGCCGMAGAYGMMRETYALSLAVARPLVERIRALPSETVVVAAGTSCRHQIADLTGRRPLHPAELLESTYATVRPI
ncbi:MAG: FAD-binding protein [Phycisphaerae bacterium]|jgi:FAD/FMN-containing dehydrogenase/Fe-S oxidoreductase